MMSCVSSFVADDEVVDEPHVSVGEATTKMSRPFATRILIAQNMHPELLKAAEGHPAEAESGRW